MTNHISLRSLYKDLKSRIDELGKNPEPVVRSRQVVQRAIEDGKAYYGINTGFGILAQKRINSDELGQLQRNLILSHAVGVGDFVSKEISRLMLKLKIHALGLGFSGISVETFEQLITLAQHDLVPAIPKRGSVGASGDLAPLAHLSLPLLGLGEVWNEAGTATIPTAEIFTQKKISPIDLQAKDGLSLINGTQLMSAHGAYVLERALRLVSMADILAALSLEALQGSVAPYDARVHEIRPHAGQQQVAQNLRNLLAGSEILESHRHCGKVQDPYSLRCIPQVHGASRESLAYCQGVVETEINSVTDNPLVFPNGDIISGGNFHGQPLALVLDQAAIALAELASISERRIYLLLEGHDGLPTLLMKETGINSGFMIPQYTAASLVSENKVLCHPASVDSIPTCLGQEDHVSMGSIGAVKLLQVLENVEHIFAIELLTAAQALDFRHPLRPGHGVELMHRHIRRQIPHREADYIFQDELHEALSIVRSCTVLDLFAEHNIEVV
ncbi:MAG: histidine ammonia-lyase [Pirellulaceae bacterium]|nr:histidine ammonia-lyase [Pirellulaceae bacterium]